MANMWYSPEAGGFVYRVAGTNEVRLLGGAEDEAAGKAYHADKREFADKHYWNSKKDYSGSHAGLFGSELDPSNPLYYRGPNQSWHGAMDDRLRERKAGKMDTRGWYENSTQYMDSDLQTKMANRNNAMEDMYRSGYSWNQIRDHMAGKVNALDEGPDWADYNKERDAYMATLKPGDKYEKQWFDKYYKGAGNQHIVDWYKQNNPQEQRATGGFMTAFSERQPTAPQPTAPQPTGQRPSVSSLFDAYIKERGL